MRTSIRSGTVVGALTAALLSVTPASSGAVATGVVPPSPSVTVPQPTEALTPRDSRLGPGGFPERRAAIDDVAEAVAFPDGPTVETAREGFPNSPTITRLDGANRYEAAANVSASRFSPGVEVAYVASGRVFPDALAAGPVAALDRGPILLTNTGRVPRVTADELERLQPKRIVVLGGEMTVLPEVEVALRAFTEGRVSRLAGANRYEAAANVSASRFSPGVEVAYVASGRVFPDALAAGPVAALDRGPILLTNTGRVPRVTADELERLQPKRIVVLGGEATVQWYVQTDLSPYVASRPVTEFLPLPGDADTARFRGTDVPAVDCPETGACVAVGTYAVDGGGHAPLLLEQTGTTWTATRAPLPEDAAAARSQPTMLLLDVACAAVGDCTAVGRYETTEGDVFDLVLSLVDGEWSVTTVDLDGLDPRRYRFWSHVACTEGGCAIAGGSDWPSAGSSTLMAFGDATGWTVVKAPAGLGANHVDALDCAPTGVCAATGLAGDSPLAVVWNGSDWTFDALTVRGWYGQGTDVDCMAHDDCLLVGEMDDDDDVPSGFLATWDGSRWSVQDPVLPDWVLQRGWPTALHEVECPLDGICVTLADAAVVGGYQVPLSSVRWSGGWSSADLPQPAGFDGSRGWMRGSSLECSAASQCTADLILPFVDGDRRRVVFVDDFPWWQAFVVDAPDGTAIQDEGDLGCSEESVCVGVGVDQSSRPVMIR